MTQLKISMNSVTSFTAFLILTLSFLKTWPAFLDLACLRLILGLSLLDTWPVSAWYLACLSSFIFGLSLLEKLSFNLRLFFLSPMDTGLSFCETWSVPL